MSSVHRITAALTPGTGFNPTDAIIALASPLGPGARAILRVSGTNLTPILQTAGLREFDPRQRRSRLTFTTPTLQGFFNVEVLSWSAPHSYTSQDLVEVHLPGIPPLVAWIMESMLAAGLRVALPGEFTLRAFLAGKLDLTQAEGVLGMISANSQEEMATAMSQMAGGLTRPLDRVRNEILFLLAEIEAGLDFAEDDISFLNTDEIARRVNIALEAITSTLGQFRLRRHSDLPFRVVLLGLPNAGKSSLFNALIGQTRSLVSPKAGTTRDYVTARMEYAGIIFELVDTAGLETPALEENSSRLTEQAQTISTIQTKSADLILLCCDCQSPVPEMLHPWLQSPITPVLPVWTKIDLCQAKEQPSDKKWHSTSTATNAGLQEVLTNITDQLRTNKQGGVLAPSVTRCRHHLEACREYLQGALALSKNKSYPELVALELRCALDELGRIVGAVYSEDLLDRIFSQFCIGK